MSETTNPAVGKPLIGREEATIDDKGRILVSKKKRDRLGENFVIALGTCGCLVAYPEASWQKFVDGILSYDPINMGREQYARLMLGYADDECNFDGQGRVVVPKKLREMAQLDGEVLIIGLGDYAEIWSKKEFEIYERFPDEYGEKRRKAIEKAVQMMKGQ